MLLEFQLNLNQPINKKNIKMYFCVPRTSKQYSSNYAELSRWAQLLQHSYEHLVCISAHEASRITRDYTV